MKGLRTIGIVIFAAVSSAFSATNKVSSASVSPEVTLRQVLGLMDQNRMNEAFALLETVPKSENNGLPLQNYLFARRSYERGEYTTALQYLAQVTTSFDRNSEWLPAALFLEGMVYRKNGQAEAVTYVAKELVLGWPESDWSRRAEELK